MWSDLNRRGEPQKTRRGVLGMGLAEHLVSLDERANAACNVPLVCVTFVYSDKSVRLFSGLS